MNDLGLALQGAWKVLAAGLVLGAGLPVIFALGLRALAYGQGGKAEVDPNQPPHPIGKLIAGLCFAIVPIGISLGITFIVASGFGKQLSFEHIIPMLVDKK